MTDPNTTDQNYTTLISSITTALTATQCLWSTPELRTNRLADIVRYLEGTKRKAELELEKYRKDNNG